MATAGETFALLGDLELRLANTPRDWEEKSTAAYAEHEVIDNRPKLQSMGNRLDEIHLVFALHAGAADIGATYNSLWESKENSEVVPLTMGDGEYLGDFVITELSFKRLATFPNGTTMAAEVGVNLKEWIPTRALTITKRDAPAVKASNPEKKTTRYTQSGTSDIVPS
jgi:phage protein U